MYKWSVSLKLLLPRCLPFANISLLYTEYLQLDTYWWPLKSCQAELHVNYCFKLILLNRGIITYSLFGQPYILAPKFLLLLYTYFCAHSWLYIYLVNNCQLFFLMIYFDRFDKIAITVSNLSLLYELSPSFHHAQMGSLYLHIAWPAVI